MQVRGTIRTTESPLLPSTAAKSRQSSVGTGASGGGEHAAKGQAARLTDRRGGFKPKTDEVSRRRKSTLPAEPPESSGANNKLRVHATKTMMAHRLRRNAQRSAGRPEACLGTLKLFIDRELFGDLGALLEHDYGRLQDDSRAASPRSVASPLPEMDASTLPESPPGSPRSREQSPMPPPSRLSGYSSFIPRAGSPAYRYDAGEGSPRASTASFESYGYQGGFQDDASDLSGPAEAHSPSKDGVVGGPRRRHEKLGEKLTKQRLQAPRHNQLKELIPILDTCLRELSPSSDGGFRSALANGFQSPRVASQAVLRDQFRSAAISVLTDAQATGWEKSTLRPGWKEAPEAGGRLSDEVAVVLSRAQQLASKQVSLAREYVSKPVSVPTTPRIVKAQPTGVQKEQGQRMPNSARAAPKKARKTNFCRALVSDLGVRPRLDQHPLLAAIDHGGVEVQEQEGLAAEQVLLARRLEEFRHGEPRGEPWAAPPERKKTSGAEAKVSSGATSNHLKAAPEKRATGKASGAKGNDMQRMLSLLDPQGTGIIEPDKVVPLMFWLGLTKKRSSALKILEIGFGEKNISASSFALMGQYVEVQLRLVEGLRNMARRESLHQLCEFMTENNCHRIRNWFNSMRADNNACVDMTQVQNLLVRMEVTSDRSSLFRFLSYMAENPNPTLLLDARERTAAEQRRFSAEAFSSLVCRSAAAWCLHRCIAMLTTPSLKQESGVVGDHELNCRWIQFQRKIVVSMLVNQRFWGRESRGVLAATNPPEMEFDSSADLDALTPEQWNTLFQRVRAQGMASVLPDDEAAEEQQQQSQSQAPSKLSDQRKTAGSGNSNARGQR
eukprot:TRINITY_DN13961_c0_g1_i1.p1 TRINITY_DN13961_c0_g1~~TRINITY_DN13961_c0_g1_i1.p1  ORF type:complete len:839 (-),score=134.75 TRINITY_DN13961_c0_g1_i1:260-2776(-)